MMMSGPQWGLGEGGGGGEGPGSGALADELGVLTLAHEGAMMREGDEGAEGKLLTAAAHAAAERLQARGGAPARALAVVDQLCILADSLAEKVRIGIAGLRV